MPKSGDTFVELADALSKAPAELPGAIEPRDRERFAIHRNNVAHARLETLRSIYPAVERLVGERFFAGLASAYFEDRPPATPLLFRQGGDFAEFVSGFAPAETVPYLADIARIEWLRLRAYHAEDAAPLAIAALGNVPKERLPELVIGLHPSLGLVRSRWPVFSIWAETTGIEAGTKTGIKTGIKTGNQVDMTEAQDVAILRPQLSVETHLLPAGGHVFLAQLANGAALGPAAQAAADTAPEFDLSQHLQALFKIGAAVSLEGSGTGTL